MNVTQNTPDFLVVESRPWLLGILLIAILIGTFAIGITLMAAGQPVSFILFGACAVIGLVFAIFVRRTQAVFHRPEGWVELRRKSVFGRSTVRHQLSEISHAVTQRSRTSDGTDTFRCALIIPGGQSAGDHPLTSVYTSGNGAERATRAINAWLDSGAAAA